MANRISLRSHTRCTPPTSQPGSPVYSCIARFPPHARCTQTCHSLWTPSPPQSCVPTHASPPSSRGVLIVYSRTHRPVGAPISACDNHCEALMRVSAEPTPVEAQEAVGPARISRASCRSTVAAGEFDARDVDLCMIRLGKLSAPDEPPDDCWRRVQARRKASAAPDAVEASEVWCAMNLEAMTSTTSLGISVPASQ